MITRIDISDFRGIAKAELDGLTPLTVLTGPNACGKSAVLDALLIGASGGAPEAVARAVQRHPEVPGGAAWLVRSGAKAAKFSCTRTKPAAHHHFLLSCQPPTTPQDHLHVSTRFRPEPGGWAMASTTSFAVNNGFAGANGAGLPAGVSAVPLIDPALPVRLSGVYADAVRAGNKAAIEEAMGKVLPEFGGFHAIEGFDGRLELYMELGGARPVPLNMSGDGVISFVQTVVQLVQVAGGLALIEEPEVCQHPSALRGTAQAIAQAVRRGTQVVLTTHSVEFIDHLVLALGDAAIHEISVHNLSRTDGVIVQGVLTGEQVRDARMEFGVDPR